MPLCYRIVFLLSYTGGGHKAVADAIQDAMRLKYPDVIFEFDYVDIFQEYCLPPFNQAPKLYANMVNNKPYLWALSYLIFNGKYRAPLAAWFLYQASRYKIDRLPDEHPADLLISVHSIITRPSFHAYHRQKQQPPFLTVVTDLARPPWFWYEPRVDYCFVPTEYAYQSAAASGISTDRLSLVGLPVNPKFLGEPVDKLALKAAFGLAPHKKVVTIVSGSEGMGQLYHIVSKLAQAQLDCYLLVICGTNDLLRTRLQHEVSNPDVRLFGYVDMAQFLNLSDVLITKAGPSTIAEACVCGVPMIISGSVPGQEGGNAEFVVDKDAGIYTENPDEMLRHLHAWLADDARLETMSRNAKALSRPDAVWQVSTKVWELLQGKEGKR
jgi:1,2-diacylglycerol 3-beta-galactosyltransferase